MTPRLSAVAATLRRSRDAEAYEEVLRVADEIYLASRGMSLQAEGAGTGFTPTAKEVALRAFVEQWGLWFSQRRIRWRDWDDVRTRGMALTLKFVEGDVEDVRALEGYDEFVQAIERKKKVDLPGTGHYSKTERQGWYEMGY